MEYSFAEKLLCERLDIWYGSDRGGMLVMFCCPDIFIDALPHFPVKL
jgi:hypothetical protein